MYCAVLWEGCAALVPGGNVTAHFECSSDGLIIGEECNGDCSSCQFSFTVPYKTCTEGLIALCSNSVSIGNNVAVVNLFNDTTTLCTGSPSAYDAYLGCMSGVEYTCDDKGSVSVSVYTTSNCTGTPISYSLPSYCNKGIDFTCGLSLN